ncbi:unnamed protein product [Phytophthora lilii]|uniref:Unnamed protein product n=1 Tax=Phytophthora lilii TaxID=2077276 RepID=A0A9W6TJK4_9STRA|nr:unnamed protein product [Phytophthora lilii]
MDLPQQALDYLARAPPDEDVREVRDQLSAFTHKDLRAACSRLSLVVPRKQNKKGGYISVLVNYWRGELAPAESASPKPAPPKVKHTSANEDVHVVAKYVADFALDGEEKELREQLEDCKSRTLRSACVLLELRPNKKHYTKRDFVNLLVNYWKDRVAVSPKAKKLATPKPTGTPKAAQVPEPNATPRTGKVREVGKYEVSTAKRTRDVEDKAPKKKKPKVLERDGDLFEKEDVMASSLEKARVVKEWASAIEILSRVDGSAESISAIRALINGVVESAASEL